MTVPFVFLFNWVITLKKYFELVSCNLSAFLMWGRNSKSCLSSFSVLIGWNFYKFSKLLSTILLCILSNKFSFPFPLNNVFSVYNMFFEPLGNFLSVQLFSNKMYSEEVTIYESFLSPWKVTLWNFSDVSVYKNYHSATAPLVNRLLWVLANP